MYSLKKFPTYSNLSYKSMNAFGIPQNNEQIYIDGFLKLVAESMPMNNQLIIQEQELIKSIGEQFIRLQISKEDAKRQLKALIGTDDPIERLDEIIGAIPIQPIPKNYFPFTSRKRPKKWTKTLDYRLITAVGTYGTDNWAAVASYVGEGMTKSQRSQRWNRCISPDIKHTNWTREEEEKLINAIKRLGDKAWTRISKEIPGRTDVQCRFRYKFLQQKMSNAPVDDLVPIAPSSADMELSIKNVLDDDLELSRFNVSNPLDHHVTEKDTLLGNPVLEDPSNE